MKTSNKDKFGKDKEAISQRIQRRREQKGWSIQEFAELLNCDDGRVWSWKDGRVPKMPMMRKIAEVTQTPLEWFLHGRGDPDDDSMSLASAPQPDDDGGNAADDLAPITPEVIQQKKAELQAMIAKYNKYPVENVKITVALL